MAEIILNSCLTSKIIYDILNLSYRLKSKYGNNTEEIDSKMKKF